MGVPVAVVEACVSCRTTAHTVHHLARMGLPVEHLADGTGYTLEELRQPTTSIPWDAYLVFLTNSHRGVSDEQYVTLCTSYDTSPFLRPLLAAAGLWFDPARYFEWIAAPDGAIRQLFRCLETRCERVGAGELVIEERVRPGYTPPPGLFWECQAIGFGALTTHFGLGPSFVTWEPVDRGAVFRVRLPKRRPFRSLLSIVRSWFVRSTSDDLRAALHYGHERGLKLEREVAARKLAEEAERDSSERLRRVTDAVPGIVYQYALDPDGRQRFTFVSRGSVGLTGYTPEELIADLGVVWRQVPPQFIPGIQASITASARDGTPWDQEFQFRTRSGEVRWIRGHSVPDPPDASGRVVWNGILTDVTERKRAETALHDRDELLRKLSEQVPGVIYQYRQWPDGRGCFPYASEGIRSVYEVTPEQVRESADAVFARLHPDDAATVVSSIDRSVETLQEWRCEYRVRLPSRGVRWLEGHSMPERLADGSTLWHGHISDITDRVRAETALRESEERFRAVFDSAPYVNALSDDGGRYLAVNRAFLSTSGLTHEQVVGKTPVELGFVAAAEHEALRSRLAAEGRLDNMEVVTAAPGGPRAYLYSARRVRIGGQFQDITSTVDVTEWKRAETALRESEEKLRTILDSEPECVKLLDRQGRLLEMNPAGLRMVEAGGLDEVRGAAVGCLVADADRAAFDDLVAAVFRGGSRQLTFAMRGLRGTARVLETHSVPLWSADRREVRALLGVTRDVTDRVRAERREAEHMLRLRTLVEVSLTLSGEPGAVFDRVVRMIGELFAVRVVCLSEIAGTELLFRSVYLDGQVFADAGRCPIEVTPCATVEADREVKVYDYVAERFPRAEFLRMHAAHSYCGIPSVDNHGRVVAITCLLDDRPREFTEEDRHILRIIGQRLATEVERGRVTSERQRAEAERDAALARLQLQIDRMPIAYILYDAALRYAGWNPAAERIFGYARHEILGQEMIALVHPDDRPHVLAISHRLRAGDVSAHSINRNVTKDGRTIVCEWHNIPLTRQDGGFDGVLSMTLNVTERVRAEEALRESEALLRQTFEHSAIGMALVGTDKRFQRVNPALCGLLGYTEAQMLERDCEMTTAPEDRGADREWVEALVSGQRDSASVEKRYLRADGSRMWSQLTVSLIRDAAGRPKYFVSLIQDIGGRMAAEAAVREAEYRQRLALDAGRMGTWDWEIGTDRLDWDDRQVAHFGFPPGGFDGRLASFMGCVHPDDLASVRQVLADAAAGKNFDGEFRIVRPTGEVRWIHGAGAVYPGNGNRPARLIGINYDVTERVAAEERLRESISEKEAMLKEIHHRVKNNLQVISSLLNLQAERIPDPDGRAVFRESQSRVRAMALVHETLYGSESLARVGLTRYIDRLCDSLLQTFGGAERVTVERAVAPQDLDLDRALPVGLVVSELVSNALKYAFPGGRRGLVRVALAPRGEADLELSVSDDGVGLPPELDLERTTSLGLYLVRVLTRQLRGTLVIGPAGGGAAFTIRFPT